MENRQTHPSNAGSSQTVVTLAETMARRLHIDQGEIQLQLHFSDGKLRRADLHRGPMRPREILELAGEEPE